MKNKFKRNYRYIRSIIRNFSYNLKYIDYTFDIQKPIFISRDLRMGKFGFIGRDSWICPNVTMGNYVIIAPKLAILGGDHNYKTPGVPVIFSGRSKCERTIIQDDVWIGYRVVINSGLTIGKGAIVAAGSIVTKNVPPYTVFGGNPAEFIKLRFSPAEQIVHEKMLLRKPFFSEVYNQPQMLY